VSEVLVLVKTISIKELKDYSMIKSITLNGKENK
jgi:hypothetical protein